MRHKVKTIFDPILHKKAEPIDFSKEPMPELEQLVQDMHETLQHEGGIGLAAPQIGIAKRIVVIDIDTTELKTGPLTFINPMIFLSSDDYGSYSEGCLSVPYQYADVVRPRTVIVKYKTLGNRDAELDCSGLLATCIQHEIDHLDGVLFVDRLSRLKRDIIRRKLKKQGY